MKIKNFLINLFLTILVIISFSGCFAYSIMQFDH